MQLNSYEKAFTTDKSINLLYDHISISGHMNIKYEWQPIETAPKDGTSILGYDPKENDLGPIYVVRYEVDSNEYDPSWREPGGENYFTMKPTHWMPLPEPPTNLLND